MVSKGMKRYRQRSDDQAALVLPNDAMIDPEAVFGRKAPLRLEIGFGHGGFLSQMAASHPDEGLHRYRGPRNPRHEKPPIGRISAARIMFVLSVVMRINYCEAASPKAHSNGRIFYSQTPGRKCAIAVAAM